MAPAGEPDGRGPVALNRRRPALSPVALFALVFYASLCVTPFLFPSQLFAQLGRGTWVVTPLELLVALWGLWVIRRLEAWLDRRVGARRGAVELWAPRLFGRLAGNLYLALLAGYFLLSAALGARVLDEILRVEELPETSVWLLAPATLLPAFVPAALGLAAVARSAQVLLFVVLPGLLAILLWPLGQATWQELLPLTTALDALRRLGSPLALASLCVLRGYVPLLLLAGRAASPRWPRPALLGFAAASLVDLTGFVAPVAVLGLPYAVRTTYPFMETIETIRVGFLPVEHLAMLTLLIWQASVFVFGALYLWAALELLTRWLPPGPWGRRLLLAAMMAATLALAGWRIAPPQEQRLLVVCNLLGAGLGILLPSLALLLSLRARAGGASGLRPRAAARGTAATAEPASRHAWRRGSALLLLLALLLGTAGCGDVEDIDKRALVVALALDAAPGGALRLTVQFPAAGDNFTGGGGGGTGGRMGGGQGTTAGAVTLQARAASWSEAVAALARRTGRALDLRTVDAVLVGEALARRGITDLVGALLREPAISKTADVLLVRGQAGALLASRPPQGTAPMATRLSRLVRNGLTRTVTDARPVALWELGRDLMTPYRTASLPEAAPGP
ncbi:MAG: spore germination protein, partial [Firmicutes bacterium]|nr:spore germination protein [Bacillota bacterium]